MLGKKPLKVGQVVRFVRQDCGFDHGIIIQTHDKNRYLYTVKTHTREYNVMHAEVTFAGAIYNLAEYFANGTES